MKHMIRKSAGAILFTAMLITASSTLAQGIEVTKITTTTEGTISEFGPQSILVKTQTGTEPLRYTASETTHYVDERGNPIAVTTVKSGLPVTVYYTKVGDTLVANKVMVRSSGSLTPLIDTTTETTTSAGTISEFGPERIVVRTASAPEPLSYSSSNTTMYVDENGAPVSIETVKSGLPVTVHYTKVGDTLVASKVIVRKAATVPTGPVIEKKTTTTTTTTDK